MKKIVFLFLLLPIFSFSDNTIDSLRIVKNEIEIKNLQKSSNELQQKYDYQVKINEQTLNSISSQIGATSYNLSIFAFLFGLLAILLGVYVTWVERKIISLKDENEKLLKETKRTKGEVVAINDLIQKDIYGLFLKIKREETLHILDRLLKIPQDITNVCESLLSRELLPDDFIKLKNAFLALPENDEYGDEYKHSYKSLFFQHFFDMTLLDINLRKHMEKFIPIAISQSFENDIIFSSKNFIALLNKKGINEFSKEINEFFKGLSKYQFSKFTPVYDLFCENLKDKNLIFELFNEIKSIPENRIAKIEYGNSILNKFKQSDFTDDEKPILEELQQLKISQLKEEEEKIKKKKDEQEKKQQKEKAAERKK
ncbi:hypothetical protein [Flavobacterium hydrophilum]|uniref:Uncharacterized protein n=1 Tax=Flavobacterium hydrophilum TaxID=2211445 RepID=A0A2V4C741_9FLAO|nr:hypothetical protein [Flavobacterium hydrophilum]PXY46452.1 hypothetical protein DMB68_04540 [Flavobacterium hydrophilum]